MEIMSFFGQRLGLLVEAIEFASFQYNHFGIIAVSLLFMQRECVFIPTSTRFSHCLIFSGK